MMVDDKNKWMKTHVYINEIGLKVEDMYQISKAILPTKTNQCNVVQCNPKCT